MKNVIEIRGVTKDYGRGRGVFDLDFAVAEGEVFGFLGPNGAGKTTTIRQLMGFIRPDKGSLRIGGMDCRAETAAIQKTLGYIPGEIALPDDMRGTAFLKFMADYRGIRDSGQIKSLCERFELDPTGSLRRMSKGMKQKIAIVCAMMGDPAVLIFDEPTSGLDPLMQNRFIDLVLEERGRGKTVLMSSHMFEEVERTCTRAGILREGRLAAVEDIEALKARRSRRYIVTLASAGAAAGFAALPGLRADAPEGNRVTVHVKDDMAVFTAALAASPVTAIDAPGQSLEDVFLHYYGKESEAK